MREWNLEQIVNLFRKAGDIALEQRRLISRNYKEDRSLVTEADRRVEKFLRENLASPVDKALFLGEESCDEFSTETLQNTDNVIWIVDPIDATANYAYGKTAWGISIGFARDGVICEGGVYIPQEHTLMVSKHGKTFLADTTLAENSAGIIASLRELAPLNVPFTDGDQITFSQGAAKNIVFKGPNSFISTGCCLTCGVDIALGRASVYVTGAKIWDFAGFMAPLRNLGCVSMNHSGTNLLSGKITDDIYRLTESERKFAVREFNWIGVSKEACERTMEMCK